VGPALTNRGQELFLIFFHLLDEGLVARIFVGCSPEDHFGEDRSEIDAFFGEQVDLLAAVRGIVLRGNDAVGR